VKAELRLQRSIAEKNIEIRNARWREDDQWNQIGGWTKVGVGAVVTVVGAGIAVGGLRDGLIPGIAVGAVGAGVIAWGIVDLTNPPERPLPEWEIERKVTITPPKGKGDAEVKMLQDGKKPAER